MLTQEAYRERQWMGLNVLRAVLESKQADYEGRLYPTSISDNEIDRLRRVAYLAGLVEANRSEVLSAVRNTEDEQLRHEQAMLTIRDLERLRDELRSIERWLDHAASSLDALCRDAYAVVSDHRA